MTTTKLLAFHGDPKIKAKYLRRVRAHQKADEIINGKYWENGKGCAVGCTLHSGQHSAYETELGIPQTLARLEDRLFERMYVYDSTKAKEWPERFLSACKPGADLSMVWPKFAHWLLVDPKDGVIQFAKTQRTRKAIEDVAALYARWIAGNKPARGEWIKARSAADAAYAYAYADATAAAYAAAYAADAATAAAYAAYAYADAATTTADAAYAAATARKRITFAMADKLIALMQEAT